MLLTGSFFRALDEKQRLSVPKPIREALGVPERSVFYLAPGTDGSLALYTAESFSKLADQLSQASPNGPEVRAFSRLFYARAKAVQLDSQGRIRVPSDLVLLVSLSKEVVLLGVRDHVELWDKSRWEEYEAGKQGHYDEIAEKAFGAHGK